MIAKQDPTVILGVGAPYTGKNTIFEMSGFPFGDAGDLLRLRATPEFREHLAQGGLATPEHIAGLISEYFREQVEAGAHTIGLSGFPRGTAQNQALEEMAGGIEVLRSRYLQIIFEYRNRDVLVRRAVKRAETSGRAEDAKLEIIEKRIQTFHEITEPGALALEAAGIPTARIDAEREPEQVLQQMRSAVDAFRQEKTSRRHPHPRHR